MSRIDKYLKTRRKAELQMIHQFWFPGESVSTVRDVLESRLTQALASGIQLPEKMARLTTSQRRLLCEVLSRPGFSADRRDVSTRLAAEGVLPGEVESAARMLQERGFLERTRSGTGRLGREGFEVPVELGERLGEVLDLDRRRVEPAHQISQKRLAFEIDFDGSSLTDRIELLGDDRLAGIVRIAEDNRGIAGIRTACAEYLGAEGANKETIGRWREMLEDGGIGTIGAVSLRDFGIIVDDPSVVIFQEWIHRRAVEAQYDVREPDTVVETGVDLYIDLDRLAARLEGKPVPLTRDGRLSKRVIEALRQNFLLARLDPWVEGDMVETVLYVARRLGIVECYAELMQVHEERLRVWRKLDLTRQVDNVLKYFLAESQGERWSFHQELLRGILLENLREEREDRWMSVEALVSQVVSTYLLELDEREVREMLRQRREGEFARERLNSPFSRLGSDLIYWIVHRFLLLGLCELGMTDGKLQAFRLTALGREVLGLSPVPRESRLLVNPNFEIILFCEGLDGLRLELALSRFGERISAERIRRYQVTRESIREGIRSGLSLAEIRELLERRSEHPLPDSVLVALGDWGRDLDWVEAVPAVLLSSLPRPRARALSDELRHAGVQHQLCPDGSIVIPQAGDAHRIGSILETLRESGWLIREAHADIAFESMTARQT